MSLSPSSRMNRTEIPGDSMSSLFDERKERFLKSLKKVLLNLSTDQFVSQMFSDEMSAMFIPDRICEVIQQCLSDDREKYIERLHKQIIKLTKAQKKLQQQIGDSIDYDYQSDFRSVNSLLEATRQGIAAMKDTFIEEIHQAQSQVRNLVVGALANKEMSANREAHMQKMLDQMQQRFSKIDIPKLTRKYEDEIAKSNEKEQKLNAKIMKLQSRNMKLSQRNQTLEDKIREMEYSQMRSQCESSRVSDIESVNSSLELQIKALKKANEEKNRTIETLLNDGSDRVSDAILKQSLSESRMRLSELEKENSSLKQQLSERDLTEDSQTFDNSMYEVDSQLMAEKNAVIPDLERRTRNAKDKVKALGLQNSRLQTELDEMKSNNESLQRQLDDMRSTIRESTEDRTEKGELKARIELLSEELSESKKRIHDLDDRVFELSAANKDLHKKLSGSAAEVKEKSESMEQMIDELSLMQQSKKSSEELVAALTKRCKDYDATVRKQNSSILEHERIITQMQKERNDAVQTSAILKTELEELRIVSKSNSASRDQTVEALEYARAEIKSKDQTIANLVQADSAARKQREEQDKKLAACQQQIRDMSSESREYDREVSNLKNIVASLEKQIENMQSNIKEKTKLLRQKDSTIEKLNSANTLLDNQLKQSKLSLTDARDQINSLREKLTTAASETRQAETEVDHAKALHTEALTKIAKLRKKLDLQKSEFRSLTTNQRQVNLELHNKLTNAQQTIESLKSESSDREKQIKAKDLQLSQFVEEADERVRNTEADIHRLERQIDDLNTQLQVLKDNQKTFLQKMRQYGNADSLTDVYYLTTRLNEHVEQLEAELQEMRTCLELTPDYSLLTAISELKSELERAKQREADIRIAVPDTDPAIIPDKIKEMRETLERVIPMQKKLKAILHTDDMVEKISEMKIYSKQFAQREEDIKTAVPEYTFDSVVPKFREAFASCNELTKRENQLKKILGVESSKDIPKQIAKVLSELQKFIVIAEEIKAVSPVTNGDVNKCWSQLREQYEEMKEREQIIESSLPVDCPDTTTTEKVSYIIDQNKRLRAIHEEIESVIPESIVGDLISRIHVLVDRYSNVSQSMKSILATLPKEFEGSVSDKVTQLVELYRQRDQELTRIGAEIPVEFEGSPAESIREIVDLLRELQTTESQFEVLIGPGEEPLCERVSQSIAELKRLQIEHDSVLKALPCEIEGTLAEQVKLLANERACLLKTEKDIASALGISETPKDALEKIDELTNELKKKSKTLSELDKVLVGEDEDIIQRAHNYATKNATNNKAHQKLMEIIPKAFNEGDLESSLEHVVGEFKHQESLVNRIRDMVSAESVEKIEERIMTIKQKLKDMSADDARIRKVLPPNIAGTVADRVSQIVTQCMGYQKQYVQLKSIIPENIPGSLSHKVGFLVQQSTKLQNEMALLVRALPSDIPGSAADKLQTVLTRYDEVTGIVRHIQQMMPPEFSGTVVQQVNDIIEQHKVFTARLKNISDILPDDIPGSVEDRIRDLISKKDRSGELNIRLKEILKTDDDSTCITNLTTSFERLNICETALNDLTKLLDTADPVNVVEDMTRELETLRRERSEVIDLLECKADDNVADVVSSLVRTSTDITKTIEAVAAEIPADFTGDTVERVTKLSEYYFEKSKTMADLMELLPETTDASLVTTVAEQIEKLKESEKLEKEIEEVIPEGIQGSLISKVERLAELDQKYHGERVAINNMLPKDIHGNLTERINQLTEQNRKYATMCNEAMKHLSRHGQGNITERIVQLNEDWDKLQDTVRECQMTIPSEFIGSLEERVKGVVEELQQTQIHIREISQMIPSDIEGNINDRISALIQSYTDLRAMKKELTSFDASFEGSPEDQIKDIVTTITNTTKTMKDISKHIPMEFSKEDVVGSVASLATDYAEVKRKLSAVDKAIPQEFTGETVERTERLAEKYNDVIIQQKYMTRMITNDSTTDLLSSVTRLLEDHEKISKELSSIVKLLPDKDGPVYEQISTAFNDLQRLQREQEKIRPCIPESITGSLPAQVRQMANELKAVQEEIDTISHAIPEEFTGNVIAKTKQLIKSRNELANEHQRIREIVPVGATSDLTRDIASLAELCEEQKTAINSVKEILNTDEENVVIGATSFLVSHNELRAQLDGIKETLPSFDRKTPAEYIRDLINEKERLAGQAKTISALVPNEFRGELEHRVSSLARSYVENKEQLDTCDSLMPKTDGGIVDRLKAVLSDRDAMIREGQTLRGILLISRDESLVARTEDLRKEADDQGKLISELATLISEGDKEALREKTHSLVDEITDFREKWLSLAKIAPGLNPIEQVQHMTEQLALSVERGNKLMQILGVSETSDIEHKAVEIVEALKSASGFASGVMTVISATKVTIEFPVSSQVTRSAMSIVEDFKRRSKDNDLMIHKIIEEARGCGYTGQDLLESVRVIKESTAEAEKQRAVEAMVAELVGVRTLQEKERTASEAQKDKFKQRMNEQRQQMLQMQEKMSQKEEEYLNEIEAAEKKVRDLANSLETEKRLRDELIRLIGGKITDREYIRAHLTPEEYSTIQKTEKIV